MEEQYSVDGWMFGIVYISNSHSNSHKSASKRLNVSPNQEYTLLYKDLKISHALFFLFSVRV